MSAAEIEIVYADKVKPELDRVGLIIDSSRRTLLKELGTEVLVVGGLITAGIFSGILPTDLSGIIEAIGGFDIAKASLVKGTELVKKPDEAKKEPYYFLWKALKTH